MPNIGSRLDHLGLVFYIGRRVRCLKPDDAHEGVVVQIAASEFGVRWKRRATVTPFSPEMLFSGEYQIVL